MKKPSPQLRLALAVTGMLSLSACSSGPLIVQTPAPIQTLPVACLTVCEPMPKPLSQGHADLLRWELGAVQAFERCAARHGECVVKLSEESR